MDGHTYYYLLDEFDNTLHICSDGKTRCGMSARDMHQLEDKELKLYPLCPKCQLPEKKASFVAKAEFVSGDENELQDN